MNQFQRSKAAVAAIRVPRLVRFLFLNMMFGVSVGVALAASLILTNAAGLKDLIAGDHSPLLMVFLLEFMFALTFASVATVIAVMTLRSQTGDNYSSAEEPPEL
jgi:hypothetical protein